MRLPPNDVKCAVGWVKRHAKRYDVDPDRVVLTGGWNTWGTQIFRQALSRFLDKHAPVD